MYSAGVFTTINTSAYPNYFCNSAAINNSGQIALTLGTRYSGLSPLLGLIDTNGVFTAISVPGSTIDSAAGLNNLGDVVGLEYTGLFYGYAAFASANGATLTSLNPNGATVGGPTFTLTVNGSSFVSGATVQWNGSPLSTSFVNGTQLTAAVPGSLIANAGSASVTVVNPGSTASNALTFSINPVTVVALSSHRSVQARLSPGGSTFNLTVFGSNFLSSGGIFTSGATVQWNGSPLLTSFVSGTQLTATVPGTLITNIGQRQHHRPEPRRGSLQLRHLHDCGDFVPGYDHCATDTATRSGRHFLLAIAFRRWRYPTLFLVTGLGSTSIWTFAIQLGSDFGHAHFRGDSELHDESGGCCVCERDSNLQPDYRQFSVVHKRTSSSTDCGWSGLEYAVCYHKHRSGSGHLHLPILGSGWQLLCHFPS